MGVARSARSDSVPGEVDVGQSRSGVRVKVN